jgi:hypothetical protein
MSYWIFEAFPVLSRLAPEADWSALSMIGATSSSQPDLGLQNCPRTGFLCTTPRLRPRQGSMLYLGTTRFACLSV